MHFFSRAVQGLATLGLCAAVLAAPLSARAQMLYDIDPPGGIAGTIDDFDQVLGFEFTLSSKRTLTALGVWDQDADGLAAPKQVGLWDSGGTLLTSTTVTNASSAFSSAFGGGQWKFEKAPNISLLAGTYVLGALYADGDPDAFQVAANTTAMAGATIGDSHETLSGSLTFPSDNSTPGAYYGPNAMFSTPAAVPEAGSIAMIAAGGLPLGMVLFRQRRTAKKA